MGAAIPLRTDDATARLRRLAKASSHGNRTRRLLALAEIYDNGSRRGSAGSGFRWSAIGCCASTLMVPIG